MEEINKKKIYKIHKFLDKHSFKPFKSFKKLPSDVMHRCTELTKLGYDDIELCEGCYTMHMGPSTFPPIDDIFEEVAAREAEERFTQGIDEPQEYP